MRYYFLALLFVFSIVCYAQADSTKLLKVTSYIEMYYSYDFSNPDQHEKSDYNYNYKKHNQLNVNLAFLKASYQSQGFRSNIALMKGTYATYNLSAEPNC